MSGGYSRAEAALKALLESDPTIGVSKTRRLGPDWNMREALLVRDYQDHVSIVIERPERAPKIEPHLGDTMPIRWIPPAADSSLERLMISCPDHALRATFLSLVGEVLDRVDSTHNSVYLEVSKVVDDWRRILETSHAAISRQLLIGLFARNLSFDQLARLFGGSHHDRHLRREIEPADALYSSFDGGRLRFIDLPAADQRSARADAYSQRRENNPPDAARL